MNPESIDPQKGGSTVAMKTSRYVTVCSVITMLSLACAVHAETIPAKVGQCVSTRVAKVGTRLEGIPGSGTSIEFSNGVYLVSYDTVPQAESARAGDRVMLCLISIPEDCPPGDQRGKVYVVTNQRTKKRFTLPDSQHQCGGA